MSRDPLGFAAGDGNQARYVANGPSDSVDPSGLFEPPKGTKANGYHGTGQWTPANYEATIKFFEILNESQKIKLPKIRDPKIRQTIGRGCVGLCLVQFGYIAPTNKSSPVNALKIKGMKLFTNPTDATLYLTGLKQKGHKMFALQLPEATTKIDNAKDRMPGEIYASEITYDKRYDNIKGVSYNWATWIDHPSGGYWQYMLTDFDFSLFGGTDRKPTVIHGTRLPNGPKEGIDYTNFYGVAPVNPKPLKAK